MSLVQAGGLMAAVFVIFMGAIWVLGGVVGRGK
jgi:hypothetical protein